MPVHYSLSPLSPPGKIFLQIQKRLSAETSIICNIFRSLKTGYFQILTESSITDAEYGQLTSQNFNAQLFKALLA